MITVHGIKLALGSEVLNMVIEHRPDDPDPAELHEGRVWFNTTSNQMKFCDHTLTIQIISISNYDIYQGLTPPINTAQLWFKDDDKILFDYFPSESKWFSVQKMQLDFYQEKRLYSGYFESQYRIKYPAIIRAVWSSCALSRTLDLRADGSDAYEFTTPCDTSDLLITVSQGAIFSCHMPVQFESSKPLFIEDARVHAEIVWYYPA